MRTMEQDTEPGLVRRLRPADLERVVAIDARSSGRERKDYFLRKLEESLDDSSVHVSLGAEVDGILVGFVLARMWTGEFGTADPVAVLDTIGVQPEFRGRGIGNALLAQLLRNLRAIGVGELRTEIDWTDLDLLRFFHRHGFQPAPRLCLRRDLALPPAESRE